MNAKLSFAKKKAPVITPTQFVNHLAAHPVMADVANPWATFVPGLDIGPEAPHVRMQNLTCYLQERLSSARILFIGEAPGYQGARWSGIAMTSERILLGAKEGALADDVFLGEKSRTSEPALYPQGANEPTATIAWSLMKSLGASPRSFVFWNAFPFHPHKPNMPLTNRAPKPHELAASSQFLPEFLSLFPDARPVAVGRVAQDTLAALGVAAPAVRHPAMGGASRFRLQVSAFVAEHNLDLS